MLDWAPTPIQEIRSRACRRDRCGQARIMGRSSRLLAFTIRWFDGGPAYNYAGPPSNQRIVLADTC